MNKPDLIALLEDLQTAKEGSRKLSNDCLFALGYTVTDKYSKDKRPCDFVTPNGQVIYEYNTQPDPTRSVDDALDCMVPEGWYLNNAHEPKNLRDGSVSNAFAVISPHPNNAEGVIIGGWPAQAAILPLAICAACIEQLIGECDD